MTPTLAAIDLPGLVRSSDPARFFANQFVPEMHRGDVCALYAFDIEISKITRTVREPMAGEIRLQWWREVFQGERDTEAAASPLASIMLELSRRHSVGPQIWQNYLDGRIFDLYDDAVEDNSAFEAYSGQTAGTILQLTCLILDRQKSSSASDVSGYLACALSLWARVLHPIIHATSPISSRLLVSTSRFLPPDLRNAVDIDENPFMDSGAVDVQAYVKEVSAAAESYIERARVAAAATPKTLRPAYLHIAPIASQISRLNALPKPQLPVKEVGTPKLIWQLWRNSKRWPCF